MSKIRVFVLISACSLQTAQTMAQFPASISPTIPLNTTATTDLPDDLEFNARLANDGAGNWVAVWEFDADPGPDIFADIMVARSSDNGATWTAPATLNSNPGAASPSDDEPQIATDGKGNWVAVWESNGFLGMDLDILVSRSTDNGATWTPVAALNTNAGTDTGTDESPQVATDGQGHWVAAWHSDENLGMSIGTDDDIFVALSSDNGATWTPPAPLNSNATTDIATASDRDVHLATDGLGHWLAVWNANKFTGIDEDLLIARSTDNGASWTFPVPLNTDATTDTGSDRDSHITTDRQGNWVVAWLSTKDASGSLGMDADLVVSHSADNGATWSPAAALNNNATTDAGIDEAVYLAADRAGNWVAVWRSKSDIGGNIGAMNDADMLIAHSADNGMTWTDPALLNPVEATDTTSVEFEPNITTDGRGNWVTAWDSVEPGGPAGGNIGTDGDILTARFALPDCNTNGIGDGQDIADGTSADCDANGVPDSCQTDSDGDGVIDACTPAPSVACGTCAQGATPATLLSMAFLMWSRRRRRGNNSHSKA